MNQCEDCLEFPKPTGAFIHLDIACNDLRERCHFCAYKSFTLLSHFKPLSFWYSSFQTEYVLTNLNWCVCLCLAWHNWCFVLSVQQDHTNMFIRIITNKYFGYYIITLYFLGGHSYFRLIYISKSKTRPYSHWGQSFGQHSAAHAATLRLLLSCVVTLCPTERSSRATRKFGRQTAQHQPTESSLSSSSFSSQVE